MLPPPMTSRARMLAALHRQPVDHVPCSFMLFKGLWTLAGDYLEFIQQQLELGLDAFVQIPARQPGLVSDSYNLHGLPVYFHPDVTIREWKTSLENEKRPILIKEYQTPAGPLRAEVRQDEDWPYGDISPFWMITWSLAHASSSSRVARICRLCVIYLFLLHNRW